MSRQALIKQMAGTFQEEMAEVIKFVELLRRQPEELSADELEEVRAGQQELRSGKWARWQGGA